MKEMRPEEISALIKEQIKNYEQKIHSDSLRKNSQKAFSVKLLKRIFDRFCTHQSRNAFNLDVQYIRNYRYWNSTLAYHRYL